jgi:hypothetical protein
MERLLALGCSSKKSRNFRRSADYDGMGWDMGDVGCNSGIRKGKRAKGEVVHVYNLAYQHRESELILECESLNSCGITLIPTSTECFASLKRPRWSKTAIVPPSIRGL